MNLIELRRERERRCDLEMMRRNLELGEKPPKPKKDWIRSFCYLIKGIQVVQVSSEGYPTFARKTIEKPIELQEVLNVIQAAN